MKCTHCGKPVLARDIMYCRCGAGLCRRCRVFDEYNMYLGRCPVCDKKGGSMNVTFGAMGKPLHEQLDLRPNVVVGFQAQVDAVALLYLRGVLTEHERSRSYDRIAKKLEKFLYKPMTHGSGLKRLRAVGTL
jgi:hypothetical protein